MSAQSLEEQNAAVVENARRQRQRNRAGDLPGAGLGGSSYIRTISDLEAAPVPNYRVVPVTRNSFKLGELEYIGEDTYFATEIHDAEYRAPINVFFAYCQAIGIPPQFGLQLVQKHQDVWGKLLPRYASQDFKANIVFDDDQPVGMKLGDCQAVDPAELKEFALRVANAMETDMVSFNFNGDLNSVTFYDQDSIFGYGNEQYMIGIVARSSPVGEYPISIGEALLRQICTNGLHAPIRNITLNQASLSDAYDYIRANRIGDLLRAELQRYYMSRFVDLETKHASFRELQYAGSLLPENEYEWSSVLESCEREGNFDRLQKDPRWLSTVITPVNMLEVQRYMSWVASHRNGLEAERQDAIQDYCGRLMNQKFDCDKVAAISLTDLEITLSDKWQ